MSRVRTTYKRFKYDFYPTPPSCVSAIYEHFDKEYQYIFVPYRKKNLRVLDAGAGTGIWGRVLKESFPFQYSLAGVDIQDLPKPEKYDLWWKETDFLTELENREFDLVVSNPPFKYAEEFVRKSLALTVRGGYVIMLVRLAFLESIKRGTGLFQEMPPTQVSVLCRRPSFHLDKKTGSDAYMAVLWQKENYDKTNLDWLNWEYEDYWEPIRKEAREHLEDLGVFDEHLESKK